MASLKQLETSFSPTARSFNWLITGKYYQRPYAPLNQIMLVAYLNYYGFFEISPKSSSFGWRNCHTTAAVNTTAKTTVARIAPV